VVGGGGVQVGRRHGDRALVELGFVDEMMDGVAPVLESEDGEERTTANTSVRRGRRQPSATMTSPPSSTGPRHSWSLGAALRVNGGVAPSGVAGVLALCATAASESRALIRYGPRGRGPH